MKAAITAVGGYLPERVLTNQDLEKMVDTTDAWIVERTGIQQRHILDTGKGAAFMAVKAVENLMTRSTCSPDEIDLVICATVTPDYIFPATANIVASSCQINNAWSFDLEAACSSFIYALGIGSQFIETGKHQKVLVIGVDKMSSILDYEDRSTCIIFGDGAGAVLLEPTNDDTGIQDFAFRSDGEGFKHLHMKAGGSIMPPSLQTVQNNLHYVYQEGRPVFKAAITNMANISQQVMQKNHLIIDDIDWFVPHQANLRIIEATARALDCPLEKIMINIQKYGNTTSATIPLCLWDWQSQLKQGDKLLITTFGGGFTWGSMYLKWAF